ncbi:MAG: universal stress protein, partial [Cyanobacteria bacterium P01_D01_bin.6]
MTFAKILIAVERPPLAFKVAETGFALAKALQAQVTLVHVNAPALLYSTDSAVPVEQIENHMMAAAEQRLADLTNRYGADLSPLTLVLEGNTEQKILEAVNDIKPDLLVIGTHGKRLWRDMLLGSISETIIRH